MPAWDWQAWRAMLPELLGALPVTVGATVVGFGLALVLGLVVAMLRRSGVRALEMLANVYVEFVRNTPLLVQLYFLWIGLTSFGIVLPSFTAGVLGLGIHYSTYLAEVYRAGIDSVPRGQWEAATALNFSKWHTWTRVILPQAVPPMIPVLGNYLVTMFKETPLLLAVGLVELLSRAQMIGSETFRYTEPVTTVGVLFFLLSYPSALFIRWLENRMNRHLRSPAGGAERGKEGMAA